MNPSRTRALWFGAVLAFSLPLLVLLATGYSETGRQGLVSAMRMVLASLGAIEPPPDSDLLKLRLLRALCAVGVGGSLALAGAMTQGLFRNPLAEPGLLGLGSGAMLGAVIAIAVLGGYGPEFWTPSPDLSTSGGHAFISLGLIPICAFIGSMAASLTIYRMATRHGRISVPALLLIGLAINSLLGALMAGIQVLLLQDWQVSRAIVAWGFGTLDDRNTTHLAVVWTGAILAILGIPFVGLELDLLAGGEDDAAGLGADPGRVKTVVLICVALSTAASVSVAGQIAFVGLLVPHVMRMLIGPHHRSLLPISFLAGAALLVGVVAFQHALCPALSDWFAASGSATAARAFKRITALQPGVLTSLLGAPCFIYLLLRQDKRW
ncbi:MAG TPA: iron ABC transporter permease [Planctomycetota bacterium]|jgi:iron complex transport system permease protein